MSSIVADSNHWLSSSSQLVIDVHCCLLLSIMRVRGLEAASGTVCRPMSPDLQHRLFFGTVSKLISFPDHFLLNCFCFLVMYTVYSSDLAVLYLSHSKYITVM